MKTCKVEPVNFRLNAETPCECAVLRYSILRVNHVAQSVNSRADVN